MANGKRDELKNLQENLGPYYQAPLQPRRNHSRENSLTEPSHSNTPEPKRPGSSSRRHDTSSRDSTPNRNSQPPSRARSHAKARSFDKRADTPRSEPSQSRAQTQIDTPPSASPRREMSQRNRSGRGSNRNNGNSHGEEAQIWELCKSQVGEVVAGINAENDSLAELVSMDKQAGGMDPDKIPNDSLKEMEQLCRTGVKHSEANIAALRALSDQLKILRAVVVAKEQSEAQAAGPGKRQATRETTASAAAASSLYDFDGGGDSPVPSPMAGGGGSSRKHGDRSSTREGNREGNRDGTRDGTRDSNRDSMPPKAESMPPKADSVEPQGSTGSGAGGGSSSKKALFSKGDAVAFKPKAAQGDAASDWILGEVAQVPGEGKSRRYMVIDIEPDDRSKQNEYRLNANSMIPIAPESQVASLKDWEPGKVVLALYPNTTTFYRAEVDSTGDDGKVNLKFEGENDSSTLQQVERRFVIEYRA